MNRNWGARVDPAAATRIRASRLADRWGPWLAALPWRWLVTLTVDPKRSNSGRRAGGVSRQTIERETEWWAGLVGRLSRSPVVWVRSLERQRSGNWHAHLVIGVVTEAALGVATGAWEVRNGWCRVTQVDDPAGAVGYVVKGAREVWVSDTIVLHGDKLRASGGVWERKP